jgi:RNA polymerase sigma-70 factor (ECF subfamily)
VFLALFQHLRSAKPRDNLRGWLFRVAHNISLKRLSRERRDLAIFSQVSAEQLAVDPAPNPEEHLMHSRLEQRVAAVIKALPEQDRTCLSLRAEGLNYREVAEVLNLSLGTVALALARSLARIACVTER